MKPKIRVKGFEWEWDNYALKEICEINPKSSMPDVFEYVDLESVMGTELITHRTEIKGKAPSRAQRLAKKGDIFYQTVRPYQKNNYLFDREDDNYVFSTGYAQLRTSIDNGYLFTLMQSSSFVNKVLVECTGTSYPAINPTNLSKIKIDIINNRQIQRIIASFFQELDNLIEATAKKIESLKRVKAASLQSMFPQEGETTPRLRFKGFTDEWETLSLGEITEIIKGEQINKSELLPQGDFYVLNGGMSASGFTNMYNVSANTISISEGGNSCGFVAFNKVPFWSGGHNYTLQKTRIDTVYLYAYLKANENIIMSKRVGSGLPNIQKKSLLEFKIRFPSEDEEQKAIGSFFATLDSQISLQTQRLEKLKQIKSACLDSMFV